MSKFDIDFDIMRPVGFYKMTNLERKRTIEKVSLDGWKPIITCPICNNNNKYSFIETDNITSNICRTCDCLYNNLVPIKQNSGWYDVQTTKRLNDLPEEKNRKYRIKRFAKERIDIIQEYSKKTLSDSSLLDFGCGTGFFLEEAKKHFKIYDGVENSKMEAKQASETTNAMIYESFKKTNKKYDVITFFDVLEHVEKPLELLIEANEYLNNDGIILAYTPNYRSLEFEILKSKSPTYMPSDHLLLFSPQTVLYICDKLLNLGLEMIETHGMDFFNLLSYERDINNIDINDSFMVQNINNMQQFIDSNMLGNNIRFILRKGEKLK